MEDVLLQAIADVAGNQAGSDVQAELAYPDEKFGDFATNAALKVAAASGGNPRALAAEMAQKIKVDLGDRLQSADIAGPGFINFRLSDKALLAEVDAEPHQPLDGQVVVTEFSDPNPFKILHAGHLYTSVIGDAISNLLEQAGAEVHRVNYGGDVGLHVAKSLWAMTAELGGEKPEGLERIEVSKRSAWMSDMYVRGSAAYEDSDQAKAEINELNKRIYKIQESDDHESGLAKIYWTTRNWSYDAFDAFYAFLNISFDKFYPESETAPIGLAIVNDQLSKGVFEQSDGAVVFRGERYGLHTRVFITKQGLPTYEAKELGLAELKRRDFKYNRSVVITANEQEQYFEVVLKALEQFEPVLAQETDHLAHGMVRLSGGRKMSSRYGNILRAEDVLSATREAASELSEKVDDRVVLAAVKYSFLKQGIGGDIIFDPKESVSVLGNSGPYLQYAHARACSILAKASGPVNFPGTDLDPGERSLALSLSRFAKSVDLATKELAPHLVSVYLYELSQKFNSFYEHNRVIGDEREATRLALVKRYAERLKLGLKLLGIEAPDHL